MDCFWAVVSSQNEYNGIEFQIRNDARKTLNLFSLAI